MPVARSHHSCDTCGYRWKDKKPGEPCLFWGPLFVMCPGTVQEYWEEAKPLPMPLDVHVRRFIARVRGRRS